MLVVLRLLMFGVLAVALWKVAVVILQYLNRPGYLLKCETCRYCEMIDQDGVMCRYRNTVTLKTIANVHNCMDYERD